MKKLSAVYLLFVIFVASCKTRTTDAPKQSIPSNIQSASSNPAETLESLRTQFLATLEETQKSGSSSLVQGEFSSKLKANKRAKTLIIKFKPGQNLTGSARSDLHIQAAAGKIRRSHKFISAATIEFSDAKSDDYLIAVDTFLKRSGLVEYVEPDFEVKLNAVPNDPKLPDLWGMKNSIAGKYDINAPAAWDVTTGSKSVVVGIIDSGVDYNHPDIAPNYWHNPGETGVDSNGNDKSTNQIDDDGNGYVDDWRGWNFVSNTNDPMDDHYHGTHVAGTIGAVGNNSVGVVGVNWNVSMVGLKFLNIFGAGNISDALAALEYAVQMKFFATNNSWGGGTYSAAFFDALNVAETANHLFIVAAGNSAGNNDLRPAYPSNYSVPNLISVAALDRDGSLAYFSNYGASTVHVGAPGVGIWSTAPRNDYKLLSGTSMAAPHVTGLAALLKSQFPDATYAQIKQNIMATVQGIPKLTGKTATSGIIDARAALDRPLDVNNDAPTPPQHVAVSAKGITSIGLTWDLSTLADGTILPFGIYTIRYAPRPILTDADWNAATIASAELRFSNQKVTATITGLPINYSGYIGIKSMNSSFVSSGVSDPLPFSTTKLELLAEYNGQHLSAGLGNNWALAQRPNYGPVYQYVRGGGNSTDNFALRLPVLDISAIEKLYLEFSLIGDPQDISLFFETDDGTDLGTFSLEPTPVSNPQLYVVKLNSLVVTARAHGTSLVAKFESRNGASFEIGPIRFYGLKDVVRLSNVPNGYGGEANLNVTATSESLDTLRYSYYPFGSIYCYDSVDSGKSAVTGPIIDPIGSDGRKSLCVYGTSSKSLDVFTAIYNWTQNPIEPPKAIAYGLPKGTSNVANAQAIIRGDRVIEYSVFVPSTNSNCDSGSYSEWSPISKSFQMSVVPQTLNTVCFKGRDPLGRVQTTATSYQWTSHVTPPANVTIEGMPLAQTESTVSVSGIGSAMFKYAIESGAGPCTSYGEYVSLRQPVPARVTIPVAAVDGPRVLCAVGRDQFGNEQTTPTMIKWTQEAYSLPLTFSSGLPASVSALKSINVTVKPNPIYIVPGGDYSANYKYQLVKGPTCPLRLDGKTTGTFFDHIRITLPPEDGVYTLCASTVDGYGRIQSVPTSYTWTKDTTSAIAVLSGLPGPKYFGTKLNATVGGDQVTKYRYAIVAGNGPCAAATYKPAVVVATSINAPLSGVGARTLCVKGIDAAGNIQISPTLFRWLQIPVPQFTLTLSGVPKSPSSKTALSIGLTSPVIQKLVSYHYALVNGVSPSCTAGISWSADKLMTDKITDDIGFGDRYQSLCVRAKNADGFVQSNPLLLTWLHVDDAPTTLPDKQFGVLALISKTATKALFRLTRSAVIPRQGTSESIQGRLCKLDLTSGALSSCVVVHQTLLKAASILNFTYDGLISGDYVMVLIPPSGFVAPVRLKF